MTDVRLRPIEERDLDHLHKAYTDPEVWGEFEWVGFRQTQDLRKRWEEDGWLGGDKRMLAVIRGGDTYAGDVSWKDTVPPAQGSCYEIGIALLPEHRGEGVGTIAQQLLVDYLFEHTPAHRLIAYTDVDNVAEQRSLEKAGFRREGELRACYFRAGQWRDSCLYARLREDPT